MIALIVGAGLVLAVVVARRKIAALQARVAALEARTDAAQRWQDEVRAAIEASKGN